MSELSQTTHLKLPFIAAGQAQKHVTHNEALVSLDTIVQLSVIARNQVTPPANPAIAARYHIAPNGAAGSFANHSGSIASWDGSSWSFVEPNEGWLLWDQTEASLCVIHDAEAIPINDTGMLALLGIQTQADSTNRLAVASPASLFTHEGGGHQIKINKAATSDTASILFQTAYSGKGEIGCLGSDQLSMKVSSDGSNWTTALSIDPSTGRVSMPMTPVAVNNLIINGRLRVNQRGYAGASLAVGQYGPDRWKAASAATILTMLADRVTLVQGAIEQAIEPTLWGLDTFAGQKLTLAMDCFTSGAILVTLAGQTLTLPAGAPRRRIALTVPQSHSGPLVLRIAAQSGQISFTDVTLVLGEADGFATERSQLQERALCQRYYARLNSRHVSLVTGGTPSGVLRMSFPEVMRAQPTLTLLAAQATFVIPGYSGAFTANPVLTAPYIHDQSGAIFYSATGFPGPSAQFTGFLSQTQDFAEAYAEI